MATLRLDALGLTANALLRIAVGAGGKDAVLVGGAVRDAVLGRVRRDGVDLDLAVPRGALAVSIRALVRDGRAAVVDPTGGLADLRARRLRLPHPRVLDDDPLRGLRGVRLEATLGLRLTPTSARAIKAAAPRLAGVAAERVRDELLELLAQLRSARALRRADALGLLTVILPEIEPMRVTTQPAPHRFPVLEHSLRAVDGADQVVARPGDLVPFGEELGPHLMAPLT